LSPSVRDVQNPDGAVLLDIQQGICFSMSQVGTKIWQLLKEKHSLDQVCDGLHAAYPEIPYERINKDVAQFVLQLKAHGLVARSAIRPLAALPRIPAFIRDRQSRIQQTSEHTYKPRFLFWKALLGLAMFDLFRFGRSFCKTHDFVRGWKVSSRNVPAHISDQVCRALNHACVWYPKRVLCLQRSTVTTCLLRHVGVRADLVMGAQKFPFKAHAWTEVNGRPVNERKDVQSLYLVWERC
jgi:hypothetical protein